MDGVFTDLGPVVDEAQLNQDLKYVDIGKKEGARCVTGGSRFGEREEEPAKAE